MDWVIAFRSPLLTNFFQYITWLGYSDFLFLFIPFCYWFCDRKIFGALPQFVFISALINSFAKSFFKDPRPDNYLNIDPWLDTIDPSFGFPSGHAQLAVVIWGFFFLRSSNLIVKIVSVFLLISISLSRIYLGVHDIYDVLGGIIIGITSLLFLELILLKKIPILININIEKVGILYFILFLSLFVAWPTIDTEPVIALGSLIIGFWLGQLIDAKYFQFNNSLDLISRFTSAFIALLGFLLLNYLVDEILALINLNHELATIISSAILGLYISFICLLILKILRLQNINNGKAG